MNFLITLACNIREAKENTTDPKAKIELHNLWKNVCHFKRAQEAIGCSSHSSNVIDESRKELSIITASKSLLEKIVLD